MMQIEEPILRNFIQVVVWVMVVAAGDDFLDSCDQKVSMNMGSVPDDDNVMDLV